MPNSVQVIHVEQPGPKINCTNAQTLLNLLLLAPLEDGGGGKGDVAEEAVGAQEFRDGGLERQRSKSESQKEEESEFRRSEKCGGGLGRRPEAAVGLQG